MEAKLLKNFTPYFNRALNPNITPTALYGLQDYAVDEPAPSAWGSIGFAEVEADSYYLDIQGAGYLAMVQINEKILPGPVQREEVIKRIARIEEQNGRKANKKDYAQVRDEVALELLPKAFIRRKLIPVIFHKDRLMIFSSSAKKCDDVIALIVKAITDDKLFHPALLSNIVKGNVAEMLTKLARDGELVDNPLASADAAVLRGENKQTIRVKDKDIASDDVQRLLKQNYSVTQLGVALWSTADSDQADAEFVVNDHLVCTQLIVNGAATGHSDEEETASFIAVAWLVARMCSDIIDALVDMVGGFAKRTVNAADIDDDDEL